MKPETSMSPVPIVAVMMALLVIFWRYVAGVHVTRIIPRHRVRPPPLHYEP